MPPKATTFKHCIILTPLFGSGLFILLYIVATLLYPGGSQADKNAIGFSWTNNYWCNLLNEQAINGQPNVARPVAMIAMVILCVTLALFWFLFANIIKFSKKARYAIALSGVVSMSVAMFLFTSYHDVVINISGVLGLVALTGTFAGLNKNKWKRCLKWACLTLYLLLLITFFITQPGY